MFFQGWTEDKKMMMNQVSGGQLKKEFKITFDFMSKDEQNAFFMPSVNGSGVNTTSNGLTIYFHANMTTNNFTIHTDMGRTHFIEISQEKSGQFYYFRIKRDNKVLFSGINNNPKTFDGSFRSRDMSRTANFNNIRVRSRSKLHFKIRLICSEQKKSLEIGNKDRPKGKID